MSRLPTFIGIGAAKAGTTWLFRCLQAHPEIFMARVKETNFFDYGTIEGRLAEYAVHFAGSEGYQAVGEISTRYLASPRGAAERIRCLLPEVRLFVCLRNPVEQVYSHYWHLQRQNFHRWDHSLVPASFEEALERYEEQLLEPARYGKHLGHWLSCFPRSQLHIIFFDDIQAQPQVVVQGLYAFLGVDPDFVPETVGERGASVRQGTAPRSGRAAHINGLMHEQLNRHIYHPLKQLIGVRQAIWLKDTLRVRQVMERLFRRSGYPKMHEQTRKLVIERFVGEIEELSLLLECDLSHWQ
jgi:hypothetical protein